jgi:hypothetical protein
MKNTFSPSQESQYTLQSASLTCGFRAKNGQRNDKSIKTQKHVQEKQATSKALAPRLKISFRSMCWLLLRGEPDPRGSPLLGGVSANMLLLPRWVRKPECASVV